MRIKTDAPGRSVREIGPGDYVRVDGKLERVVANTAEGAATTPKDWTVVTERGARGMFQIGRYAKKEDVE